MVTESGQPTGKCMLTDLVKHRVGPVLKRVGFSNRGMTWNRLTGQFVNVLDFQRRPRGSDGGVDFTLNIGLWSEQVWCICWGRKPPDFVREQDCFPRFRVGAMLDGFPPRPLDKWWHLDGMNTAEVEHEVARIIQTQCLPFFQDYESLDQALRFAQKWVAVRLPLEQVYLCIYLYLCGEREKSMGGLDNLVGDEYWGDRARAVRDRLAAM